MKNKLEEVRNSMIDKIEELFDVNITDRNKRLTWKSLGINHLHFDHHTKKIDIMKSAVIRVGSQ